MAKAAWWLLRQFCGTRKILVGFAAFLNRFFISEPAAHTVVFFYFKFHFFFRECGYRSSSTESSPNLCGKKKSVLKKKQPTNTEVFSRKRNHCFFKEWKCWRGCGCIPEEHETWCQWSLVVQTAREKLRRPVPPASPCPGALPSPCPGRITGSDRLGRRARAPVPTLSPKLGPLSPSGRTRAPIRTRPCEQPPSQKVAPTPPRSFLT